MKKTFITFGTTEGQTAKIAEFISDALRDHGHDVTMLDVKDEQPARSPTATTV